MQPDRGCFGVSMLLAIVMLGLCACSSGSFTDPRVLAATEISGIYSSTDSVGVLGQLRLELARVEQSRVYAARISGEDPAEFGTADAIGTLAENHLVLHFDRGMDYDYYFEGQVLSSNGMSTISGHFIFPDQEDQLPVEFIQLP